MNYSDEEFSNSNLACLGVIFYDFIFWRFNLAKSQLEEIEKRFAKFEKTPKCF